MASIYPDRVIAIRGDVDSMSQAENIISAKLRECYERDMVSDYKASITYMYIYIYIYIMCVCVCVCWHSLVSAAHESFNIFPHYFVFEIKLWNLRAFIINIFSLILKFKVRAATNASYELFLFVRIIYNLNKYAQCTRCWTYIKMFSSINSSPPKPREIMNFMLCLMRCSLASQWRHQWRHHAVHDPVSTTVRRRQVDFACLFVCLSTFSCETSVMVLQL